MESETVALTEDARDEVRNRGIIALPDAQIVTLPRDAVSPVSEIVVYELDGEFGKV